jgi:hypothetical protein
MDYAVGAGWVKEEGEFVETALYDNVFDGHTQRAVGRADDSGLQAHRNRGYRTRDTGRATVANGGTISHGLAELVPTFASVGTQSRNRAYPRTVDPDTIEVGLETPGGLPVETPETVYWEAEFHPEK